jgi:hypothetical protein
MAASMPLWRESLVSGCEGVNVGLKLGMLAREEGNRRKRLFGSGYRPESSQARLRLAAALLAGGAGRRQTLAGVAWRNKRCGEGKCENAILLAATSWRGARSISRLPALRPRRMAGGGGGCWPGSEKYEASPWL